MLPAKLRNSILQDFRGHDEEILPSFDSEGGEGTHERSLAPVGKGFFYKWDDYEPRGLPDPHGGHVGERKRNRAHEPAPSSLAQESHGSRAFRSQSMPLL